MDCSKSAQAAEHSTCHFHRPQSLRVNKQKQGLMKSAGRNRSTILSFCHSEYRPKSALLGLKDTPPKTN